MFKLIIFKAYRKTKKNILNIPNLPEYEKFSCLQTYESVFLSWFKLIL